MSRVWNGKALVDELAVRLWDTSTANKNRIIIWLNEIQDDLTSEIPLDYFKFRLKKLLPVSQEEMSLNPETPTAPTVAMSSGGSLTESSVYKITVTFLIWDGDTKRYMESEQGTYSTNITATSSDKTIDITDIPLYSGDTSYEPSAIYRRIYMATSTDSGATFSEPFFSQDIEDNITTTASITSETTSTITPPSDTEVDQISSDNPFFLSSGKYLARVDMAKTRRSNPQYSTSATPYFYDYIGHDRISLYPRLSSDATTAQRTLSYYVFRRPHEVFYDVNREIDLPITFKKALIEGVTWKAYVFRDRDGQESKAANYEQFKKQVLTKATRQRNRPSSVRDVTGDTWGYSVQ